MNRTEKQGLVDELSTKIKDATVLYYTDFTGLNVKGMTELRRRLRKAGVEYVVIKNTLAARAVNDSGLIATGCAGPTGMVIAQGSGHGGQGADGFRQGVRAEAGGEGRVARGPRRSTPRRSSGWRRCRPASRCCRSSRRAAITVGRVRRSAQRSVVHVRRSAVGAACAARGIGSGIAGRDRRSAHRLSGNDIFFEGYTTPWLTRRCPEDEILEAIGNMSVFELADLIEAFKTQVQRDHRRGPGGCGSGGWRRGWRRGAAAAVEEQTEFAVVLKEAGAKKIQVIKVVREVTASGPQGSQGSGRWRAADGQGGRHQGRGRHDQDEARGTGGDGRGEVITRVRFPASDSARGAGVANGDRPCTRARVRAALRRLEAAAHESGPRTTDYGETEAQNEMGRPGQDAGAERRWPETARARGMRPYSVR